MGTAFLGAGAQICINRGLQLEKAGPATSMRFLDIILSYIWQVWILHEKTDGYSIIGAILVSICLIMMGMKKWWNVRKARLVYEQLLEIHSSGVCLKQKKETFDQTAGDLRSERCPPPGRERCCVLLPTAVDRAMQSSLHCPYTPYISLPSGSLTPAVELTPPSDVPFQRPVVALVAVCCSSHHHRNTIPHTAEKT